MSFRGWNSTIRQLTYDFPIFYKEFPKYGDWFHIGEGIIYFYLLPLADPTDHETVARAPPLCRPLHERRPEARNYDPKLKSSAPERRQLGSNPRLKGRQCPCILPPWYGSHRLSPT